MRLEGKTVLITGGTGDLGRVVVHRFEREGARVFLTTRGPLPAGIFTRALSAKLSAVRTDVTNEKSVAGLFAFIARKAGKVDILVNTVGGFSGGRPVAKIGLPEWDSMLALNLKSVFLCSRAFLRQKGIGKYGRIINISAQTVFRPSLNRAAYAVAKGGVAALTTSLGEELRGGSITVNALAPSIIDTPANRKSMPRADFSTWVDPGVLAEEMIHLCRPGAGAINGAVIPIFGGV